MALSQENKNDKEIIIVSGLPRSGTSLMMKMLEVAGLPLHVDNLRKADQNNPNGYFEFEPVMSMKQGDTAWLGDAVGKVVKVVSPLIQYLPSQFKYKVIFMERDLSEILRSQEKMLDGMEKEHSEESTLLLQKAFSDHLSSIRQWMSEQSNFEVQGISYNNLFTDAERSLVELQTFLGDTINIDLMRNVIDPELYRNRQSQISAAKAS